jgi:hypothetical protein
VRQAAVAVTRLEAPDCRPRAIAAPVPVHASTRKRKRRALYAWELYGAKPPRFWIAASHTTGDDEWKDGVLRIGTYWFGATRATRRQPSARSCGNYFTRRQPRPKLVSTRIETRRRCWG